MARPDPENVEELGCAGPGATSSHITFLSISFRKSAPPKNRELVVRYFYKYSVDGSVGELTF